MSTSDGGALVTMCGREPNKFVDIKGFFFQHPMLTLWVENPPMNVICQWWPFQMNGSPSNMSQKEVPKKKIGAPNLGKWVSELRGHFYIILLLKTKTLVQR